MTSVDTAAADLKKANEQAESVGHAARELLLRDRKDFALSQKFMTADIDLRSSLEAAGADPNLQKKAYDRFVVELSPLVEERMAKQDSLSELSTGNQPKRVLAAPPEALSTRVMSNMSKPPTKEHVDPADLEGLKAVSGFFGDIKIGEVNCQASAMHAGPFYMVIVHDFAKGSRRTTNFTVSEDGEIVGHPASRVHGEKEKGPPAFKLGDIIEAIKKAKKGEQLTPAPHPEVPNNQIT